MRLLFLAISILSTSLSFAQTLQGKLLNPKDSIITLFYSYDYIYEQYDTVRLNSKNEFRKSFAFKNIGQVKAIHNNLQYDFILYPGSTLSFTADFSDFNTLNNSIQLKGPDAGLNISHRYLTDPQLKQLSFDYDLPADKFAQRMQDWRRVRDSLRNALINAAYKKPYSAKVREYLKMDSVNTLYWTVFALRDYHSYALGIMTEDDSFYVAHIKPYMVMHEDDLHMSSDMYRSIWGKRIADEWRRKRETRDTVNLSNLTFTAFRLQRMKATLPSKLKETGMARLLQREFADNYEEIPLAKYPYYDSLLALYGKEVSNPLVLQYTQKRVAAKKEMRLKTEKGARAANFKVVDSTGKIVRLSDFKGKMVYVDVWASWCGPCIAELPAYKKLVNEFRDRNDIVFVSVSIDSRKKDWIEKGIIKHLPPGLQLWAGEAGGSSEFAQQYFIRYVPKYILIDKEGKLMNYNLPSPSDPESKKNIEEALGM